jgi:hypothetical protein
MATNVMGTQEKAGQPQTYRNSRLSTEEVTKTKDGTETFGPTLGVETPGPQDTALGYSGMTPGSHSKEDEVSLQVNANGPEGPNPQSSSPD